MSTAVVAPTSEVPDVSELQTRIAYLGPHGLLMFGVDPKYDKERQRLGYDIAMLDKRARREMSFGSPQWEAVIQLLVNAISIGVDGGDVEHGKELLAEATKTFAFYQRLPVRNRLVYLSGLLGGIGITALAAWAFSYGLSKEWPVPSLMQAFVLAGFGSLASVLARLNDIDALRTEHAWASLLLAGATRPVLAAIVAIPVSVLVGMKVVTINIGEGSKDGLYLVTSFLCGFSERFGDEILGKVAAAVGLKKA
jgi:hypothetical protein